MYNRQPIGIRVKWPNFLAESSLCWQCQHSCVTEIEVVTIGRHGHTVTHARICAFRTCRDADNQSIGNKNERIGTP
jgi:hypothetical protein